MSESALRFLRPPTEWPEERRKKACKVAVRRARQEVRAGKRALSKGDCGVADLARLSAARLFGSAQELCGPCDLEKSRAALDEAFELAAGVTACERE